ncbi:diacylglycerol kinase family protein [Pedobacter sp. P351]|uniref:diacylglycerol kinase n=1 Tax=Pedobacter superstes TaxID=3133441 RepID=UPI00309BAF28
MKKFFKGFLYAWQGIVYAFATQINFKFHTFSAIVIVALGCFFKLDLFEWLWISAAIILVVVAELFNTALEVLVDLVSPDYNEKSGIVKDLSSAAVLLTAVLSAIIGISVFLPKILAYAS